MSVRRAAAEPPKQLTTILDAAQHIGVCTMTIRRRIASGELTGYRFGPRLIRVDLAEVDALLRVIPTAAVGDRRDA